MNNLRKQFIPVQLSSKEIKVSPFAISQQQCDDIVLGDIGLKDRLATRYVYYSSCFDGPTY